MKVAVAGTGYVGLSMAVLLSQHNEVRALDIVPGKVEKINSWRSPIRDREIERFMREAEAGERELSLRATLDPAEAYAGADYVVVATPTNYDPNKNFFDTSSVEAAVDAVRSVNPNAWIVIKSTVPVGYTAQLREERGDSRIFFSPEFLREGEALYDNLHPSRIVVGCDKDDVAAVEAAKGFAALLAEGAAPEERSRENADGTRGIPELVLGSTEAEAVKLFANTYLALRVSYFNELDTYCELHPGHHEAREGQGRARGGLRAHAGRWGLLRQRGHARPGGLQVALRRHRRQPLERRARGRLGQGLHEGPFQEGLDSPRLGFLPGFYMNYLEASGVKATVKMDYGFRSTDNLIALLMLRCSDAKPQLPWNQSTSIRKAA